MTHIEEPNDDSELSSESRSADEVQNDQEAISNSQSTDDNKQSNSQDDNQQNSRRISKREKHVPKKFPNYEAYAALAYVDDAPNNYSHIQKRPDANLWCAAINEEMKNMRRNDAWDLIEPPDNERTGDQLRLGIH